MAFFYPNLLKELSNHYNRIFILNGKTKDKYVMPDFRYLSLELVLHEYLKKVLKYKSVAFIDSDGLFFWDYVSACNLMGLPEKRQKRAQGDLANRLMKRPKNITTIASIDSPEGNSGSTEGRLRYDFSGSTEQLITKVRSMLKPISDDFKAVAGDTAVVVLEKGFLFNINKDKRVMVNFSGFLKEQFYGAETGSRNILIFIENSECEQSLAETYREKGLQDLFSYSPEDRKLKGLAKYVRILSAGKKECLNLLGKLRIVDQKDTDLKQKDHIATMLACCLRENNREIFHLNEVLYSCQSKIDLNKVQEVLNQTMEKSAQEALDEMIGMEDLKKEIKDEIKGYPAKDQQPSEYPMQYPERLEGDVSTAAVYPHLNHYVLVGNPGTGKTKVAKIIARLLQENGLLPTGQFIQARADDLIAEHVGGTAVKTRNMIEKAQGGVLFIDEAYAIKENDQFGKQCLAALVEAMTDLRGRFVLIMAGYKNEMNELIDENTGMGSRVKIFELPDYNEQELAQIMTLMIKKHPHDPEVVEKAQTYVSNLMQGRVVDEKWGNARVIESILIEAQKRSRIRNKGNVNLAMEDFPNPEYFEGDYKPKTITLDSLIGLDQLKEKIEKLIAVAKEKREKDQNYSPGHFVFAGNPGTGKTEVAKILANEFYRIGILETPKVVFKSAGDFIKGYMGHSEENVKKEFHNALGGILVIDEAHQLAKKNSYGPQVLETLVPLMENHRNDIVVVLAGYPGHLSELYTIDPGLGGRLSQKVEFRDYYAEELLEIFLLMWTAENPEVEVPQEFHSFIREHFEEVKRLDGTRFNNARYARNFKDKLFENYAYRVQNDSSAKRVIIKEDLKAAMEESLNERR